MVKSNIYRFVTENMKTKEWISCVIPKYLWLVMNAALNVLSIILSAEELMKFCHNCKSASVMYYFLEVVFNTNKYVH